MLLMHLSAHFFQSVFFFTRAISVVLRPQNIFPVQSLFCFRCCFIPPIVCGCGCFITFFGMSDLRLRLIRCVLQRASSFFFADSSSPCLHAVAVVSDSSSIFHVKFTIALFESGRFFTCHFFICLNFCCSTLLSLFSFFRICSWSLSFFGAGITNCATHVYQVIGFTRSSLHLKYFMFSKMYFSCFSAPSGVLYVTCFSSFFCTCTYFCNINLCHLFCLIL